MLNWCPDIHRHEKEQPQSIIGVTNVGELTLCLRGRDRYTKSARTQNGGELLAHTRLRAEAVADVHQQAGQHRIRGSSSSHCYLV